jgi:hypothetical protein
MGDHTNRHLCGNRSGVRDRRGSGLGETEMAGQKEQGNAVPEMSEHESSVRLQVITSSGLDVMT